MTFMSWLVVFLFALKHNGNVLNGLLALVGIAFAHLATNLFDDYSDYKYDIDKGVSTSKKAKNKCEYLKSGEATLQQLLRVVIIYCSIAFLIGVYLAFVSGWGVVILALIGGIITLTYSKISSAGFSEIYVGTAFGPLLFEGVYYVMCKRFSLEVLWISLAIVMYTVGLVYMNNLLDYENDVNDGKKSLCVWLGNSKNAALGLLGLYCLGYMFTFILASFYKNIVYYLPIITIFYAYEVYRSALSYCLKTDSGLETKWWYFPLDNWQILKTTGKTSFYLRLFLARNLMIWFSVLMCVAVLFSYRNL